MTEIYEFEEFIKWSYPIDIVEIDDEDFLNEISLEQKCLLGDCTSISSESIEKYLEKLPITKKISVIHLFRILTGIAKTNFEIFFTHWLVEKLKGSEFSIVKNNRGKRPFALRTLVLDQEITMTVKSFAELLTKKEIRIELIDFFNEKGLLKKLSIIKQDPELGNKFLKYLIRYDSRGSDAHKRGKIAEEKVRKKLEDFGYEQNVDFNTSDRDTKEALSARLVIEKEQYKQKSSEIELKKSKIENMDINRASDLVLPQTSPSVFIQSSFYGSDVASIADATVSELEAEKELFEIANSVINKNKIAFIGLIDGPGWAYSISFQRLSRVLNAVDDYFGLRTISTKLRKIMHKNEITLPIDFEVAIFINCGKGNKADIVKIGKELYGISEEILNQELEKWIDRNKFDVNEEIIKIKSDREEIIKKIVVIDIAYLLTTKNKDGEIIVPEKGPVKIEEIKKIISDYNIQNKIDLDQILESIEADMEIIKIEKNDN